MKLEEAIEITHDHIYHPDHDHDLKTQNAMLLGIEALKRYLSLRENYCFSWSYLLPGETEE